MFTKIVVGIDGSDTSKAAIRTACALAKTNDATLVLVHAPHPETVAFATGAIAGYHMVTTMPGPIEVDEAAEKTLAEGRAVAVEAGYPVTRSIVRHGDPGDEILAVAKEEDADLIVTGRRGLGNITGLVLGSTSQHISHHATCAVLTVI